MPPPSSSTPGRMRHDTMKDNILKESTGGWSNGTTPLRIAKREGGFASPNSDQAQPLRTAVARRSSNSFKHVFNNNLVSRSPFKSQIPAPSRISPRQPLGLAASANIAPSMSPRAPRTPRKVSGEKRARPDSLIAQAEQENALRIKELGFKRRQSRGFQGLVEREVVSKSPFKRVVGGSYINMQHQDAIAIEFPTKHDTDSTSPDTTETDSSLNSKDSMREREHVHVQASPRDIKLDSPPRPLTPPQRAFEPRNSPSPGFERRSPGPSALQGSPARSSLVQKSRLIGPRSRSLSAGASSAADTPTRQRRKTVTFDERCDVVEFDRESHEGSVFETDDEEVYGGPERQSNTNVDSSADSSNASADYAAESYATPTHSPRRIIPEFDAKALDDSINGLVDSMLQEYDAEPSTPSAHSNSLSSVVADIDMMTGGAENGVPLGRTHHAERAREYHHVMDSELNGEPMIPAPFGFQSEAVPNFMEQKNEEEEDLFSSNRFSTPPSHTPTHTPQAHGENNVHKNTPLPTLPPDTERAEDGMPLGRTHHAERARAAHAFSSVSADTESRPLPPSPSPSKKPAPPVNEHDMMDFELPKFDLGLGDFRTSSPRANSVKSSPRNEDVFGNSMSTRDILADLEFDHPDIDPEVLSNTSIASFHEFPPQSENGEDDHYHEERNTSGHERSMDLSFGRHSNMSLDASVASIVNELKQSQHSQHSHTTEDYVEGDHQRVPTETTDSTGMEVGRGEDQQTDLPVSRLASPLLNMSQNSIEEYSRSQSVQPRSPVGLYEQKDGRGSRTSIMTSDSSRDRSPRISRDDIMQRLAKQRSAESMSHIGSPPAALLAQAQNQSTGAGSNQTDSLSGEFRMPGEEMSEVKLTATPPLPSLPPARPTLEERLRRALSPTLSQPSPLRPTPPLSVPSPKLSSAVVSQTASPLPAPVPLAPRGQLSFDVMSANNSPLPEMPPRAQVFEATPHSPFAPSFDFDRPGVEFAEMDMRSALDRLVDDVSIAGGVEGVKPSMGLQGVDHSILAASSGEVSLAETELITEESTELLANLRESLRGHGRHSSAPAAQAMERTYSAPEPSMPHRSPASMLPSPRVDTSFTTSPMYDIEEASPIPPPVPPKTPEKSARQAREEMIREKRRIARGRESGEYFVPPRRDATGKLLEESPASKRYSQGRRPSARRSMSMGELEDYVDSDGETRRRISVMKNKRGGVLGVTLDDVEMPLTDSIEKELRGRAEPRHKKTYELRERADVVYASSSQEDVSRLNRNGEENVDKAWRTVKRPSDVNEYARQIKEFRAKEGTGKQYGKLFVKVIGIGSLRVPLPAQTTLFSCTLNNGIHFVTTPDCRLSRQARIEQEFELVEHPKLEFTLTLKVRRDPHIIEMFKAITPPTPAPPPPPAPAPTHRSGMRSFFGGSPKKPKVPKHSRARTEPVNQFVMEENLARYMKPDGTLARAFIVFKNLSDHCDMKLFETSLPLIGHKLEMTSDGEGGAGGTMNPGEIGEIILQMFRLPPMPGVPSKELPQSLEDCHTGLRNVRWHKETYIEGVLTQLGGDCSTWRRRQFRVVGGSLVAYNDVTKRAIVNIDLKKAISVEDDQDPYAKKRDVDDFDVLYGVERSFRLIFHHNQEIIFFADTDEEKARWLEVFNALIGSIPPHPLWAEICWTKLNDPLKVVNSLSSMAGEDYRRTQR